MTIKLYSAYGVSNTNNFEGYHIKEFEAEERIPENEITDDIILISISNSADVPNECFVAVEGYDKDKVTAMWEKVTNNLPVDQWWGKSSFNSEITKVVQRHYPDIIYADTSLAEFLKSHAKNFINASKGEM